MPLLENSLKLERCPHCKVSNPNLPAKSQLITFDSEQRFERFWNFYQCLSCGGIVTAWSLVSGGEIFQLFPEMTSVEEDIPEKARYYLNQAIDSIHAPAGAIMLCASAIDAMLKIKGYKSGTLYSRIDAAVSDHLITQEMAKWAHQIRLDANDERHADDSSELPDNSDAERTIGFALALGEFLFVLPAKVTRGVAESK